LIEDVKKERLALAGRPGRRRRRMSAARATSPDAIKRAVYERDGGRCTFADERGRRCGETGALEFDHVDGFARTGTMSTESGCFAARTTSTRQSRSTDGPSWNERGRHP